MNETLVTMLGNVASAVSYTQTTGGVPVANFRLVATERRYDRVKGEWVDGDTHWVTVVAWRWLAANLVSSLSKGDPVVVSGRLRIREWEEGERRRSSVEIDARSVGHDLSRGTSAFRWAVRARAEPLPGAGAEKETGAATPGGAPAETAVPEWIVAAVEARRASVGAGREAAGGPLPEGEAAVV
ncbi:single-stranded DNA-binding protein [Kitasatospora sp. NPDC057223]|uniref:single-stranded DNA-binding protein n=1 Tax=Kitasatospora sp. NPDC057223 TaxID=3346055 RepID=UPI00363B8E04